MKPDIYIKIIKSKFELNVYSDGLFIQTFTVGVGQNPGDKEYAGDKRTPEGIFYVACIEDSSKWMHDFHDGRGMVANAYGPWFIRLYTGADTTKSGKSWIGIGIHGTHDPDRVGTLCTEGCIRMTDSDLLKLVQMVEIGTQVEIIP
jgi:lipoprotein-anchoring transpeptidase ErfK/SrfK